MEANRWLRYLVPGAVFIAVVAGWIYSVDALFARHPYGDVSSPDTGAVAALAAASVPIGFALSVLMHMLKRRPLRCFVSSMDDGEILRRSISTLAAPGLREEEERGFLDAELHTRFGRANGQATLQRARSLLDLTNAVSTLLVSVSAAWIVVLVAGFVAIAPADDPNSFEWPYLAAFLFGLSLFGFVLWASQRRLTDITQQFLIGAFQLQPPVRP